MHRRAFLITTGIGLIASRSTAQFENLIELGERLAQESLDPAILSSLQSLDLGETASVLLDVARQLQGEYVVDLAALEEAVTHAIPLLASHPETQGYAAWLRAHADYFRIADYFNDNLRRSKAPTSPGPGQRPAPRPIPTPDQQRKAWQREIGTRPVPKGSQSWVPRLKPIFRSAGSPPELVWIAEIESGFDPAARSPVGAVGLYQLMPRTAEGLGLRLRPADERLEGLKNARAAANYLRQLHRQFKDWPLTLAAYNAGPGRVSEILKKRNASSFDAIAPSLPAETQMYVPKLEVVLRKREQKTLSALRLPA